MWELLKPALIIQQKIEEKKKEKKGKKQLKGFQTWKCKDAR